MLFGSSKNFSLMTGLTFMGIWAWFIFDYKMLQYLSFYLIALAISIIVVIYSSFLLSKLFPFDYRFVKTLSFLPLFLLIIQLPLRRLFIILFKREPVVDKPAPSIADFFYSMILWMSSLIIPILTINYTP